MVPHFTDTEVTACFQELMGSRVNIDLYKEIIDKFVPVKFQSIPPLKIINKAGSSNRINEQRELEDEFYDEKFVPSPELLLSYQQTFIKSLRGQEPSALANKKLMNLYQEGPLNTVNPFVGKQNNIQNPVTVTYQNISSQYNYVAPRAQNKHVFVEEREEAILRELNSKQKMGLQMSIPVIEKSLMQNEIRNLRQKDIAVENLGKLSAWKSKREQIENSLKGK